MKSKLNSYLRSILFCVVCAGLSGCSMTSQDIKARVAKRSAFYLNGREAIQSAGASYITTETDGILLTEFDHKPFFVIGPQVGFFTPGPDTKYASPARFGYGGIIVVPAGKHFLQFSYEGKEEWGLLGVSRMSSTAEVPIEFLFEKEHCYRIEPNFAIGEHGKVWHPTLVDIDAIVESKSK